jgi:carboxymethylenebutenolidase
VTGSAASPTNSRPRVHRDRPDLLSNKGPNGGGTEAFPDRDAVVKAVRDLKTDDVDAMLNATRDYGIKLPAANGKSATVGFCWGGGTSFRYATVQPGAERGGRLLRHQPENAALEKIKAPVMGFYGGNDARVNNTIKPPRTR